MRCSETQIILKDPNILRSPCVLLSLTPDLSRTALSPIIKGGLRVVIGVHQTVGF